MKAMKTVKGRQYCVTANEDVTITDVNGLHLTCPAGQQTYFIANGDEVTVEGDGVVTQTRGGIIAGGGGDAPIPVDYGKVVLGTPDGQVELFDCQTLVDGQYKFYKKPYLRELDMDFPAMTSAAYMCWGSPNLERVNVDCPELTSAANMFQNCTALKSFVANLPKARTCSRLLANCSSLTEIDIELPIASDVGFLVYSCAGLKRANIKAPVAGGSNPSSGGLIRMCYGCTSLESLNLTASQVSYGNYMCDGCTSLTSFDCSANTLSKLTQANYMFRGCKLDIDSLNLLADRLPSYSSGSHPIHIGASADVDREAAAIARTKMVNKRWTVTLTFN